MLELAICFVMYIASPNESIIDISDIRQEWSRYYSKERVDVEVKAFYNGQQMSQTSYFRGTKRLLEADFNGELTRHAINEEYGFELRRATNRNPWSLFSWEIRSDKLRVFSGNGSNPPEFLFGDTNLLEAIDSALVSTAKISAVDQGEITIEFTVNREARARSKRIWLSRLAEGQIKLFDHPPYLPKFYRLEFDQGWLETRLTYESIDGSLRLISKTNNSTADSDNRIVESDESTFHYNVPPIKDSDFYLSGYGMTEPPMATSRDRSSYWMIGLILVGILLIGIGFYVQGRRKTG